MKTNTVQPLLPQLDAPFGEIKLAHVRVGRIAFEGISIIGREAAIKFHELLCAASDRTKRIRVSKNGTRYADPLPMGSPARLLSVEIRDYLRDMERRNLRHATIEGTSRTLQILLIACGDIPVSRIERQHILVMWDLLRWGPSKITSAAEFKGLSAETLIVNGKAAGVPSPAAATFELHHRFLAAFFNNLVRARAIPFSPMDAFGKVKVVDLGVKVERLFSDAELQKIFDPRAFCPWASKFPHRWWAPMIGLYTGARINEIAQLKVADIVKDEGVWCFHIQRTADLDLHPSARVRTRQSLKGRSSIRKVPIAQPLLDAGFLTFLDDIRACGHPRLFPHLSAGINRKTGETNSRYSQGLVNQFGTYLKSLGFAKGIGNHAFRHTFATELAHSGVQPKDIALITGHSLAFKVPVLEDAYIHKQEGRIRVQQLKALAQYKPPVVLPVYTKGQFADRLRKGVRMYP